MPFDEYIEKYYSDWDFTADRYFDKEKVAQMLYWCFNGLQTLLADKYGLKEATQDDVGCKDVMAGYWNPE